MFWNSGNSKKPASSSSVAAPQTTGISDLPSHPNKTELQMKFDKVRSALPLGATIQGKLSFDSAVRIDGKLGGELYSSDTIVLGETSVVDATIEAKTIILLGKYSGSAKASEYVEIHKNADCSGNLKAPKFSIAEGARVKMQISFK